MTTSSTGGSEPRHSGIPDAGLDPQVDGSILHGPSHG
jgi:hypothetical protein